MIKIDKSKATVPPILDKTNSKSKGNLATQSLKAEYDAGKSTFDFDSNIYGHTDVKQTLIQLQYGKCCFCESFVRHIAHGDVEHFRPKAGYLDGNSITLLRPGYYWLAYDFENLFLSCQVCNQTYKRNFFPLVDDSKRVNSHHNHADLHLEEPLIIDPAKDSPKDHLYFDQEIPKGKDNKGTLTIERLGLDRSELNENRLRWLKLIMEVARYAENGDKVSLDYLIEAAQDQSEYSLMIRSNFPFLQVI